MKNQKMGCFGFLAVIFVIAILVKFWYVWLALVVLAIAGYLYYRRRQQAATAETAAKEQAQADEQARITRLKAYKALLDSGTITQAEYDKKKAELLQLDSHDDLKF